jgi:SAM-dependent methyltransferase
MPETQRADGCLNTPEEWSARALEIDDPCAAVRWSPAGQADRFASVIAALDPQPHQTFLDFGCGLGALADLLPPTLHYTGYDWAHGMITRARCERGGPRRIFTTIAPRDTFDLIACVGPFNLAENWSKESTWDVVADLWKRCVDEIAVCLYAGDDSTMLSYTVDETKAFAELLTDAYLVLNHRANDLLLLMR